MGTGIALIPTKLTLASSTGPSLTRDQIVRKLNDNIDKRLSLIWAGPGYGKTELASALASASPHKVVWYTIDSYDSDEMIFASHLLAGLAQACPEANWSAQAIEAEIRSRQRLVSQIVTQLQSLTERIIIVLDNFHEIEDDSSSLEFIDLLLRYAPKQLHFIITTRKIPFLRQISRLRSQGEVLVLTATDLAFTTAEIQALYQLHSGATLSLTVARHLKEHTFGWPLSIHLTLKSLGSGQKTLDADTTNQQLIEYIKSEIFAQHPAQIQDFFRDISIFNTLTPSVVEAVLGYQDAPALFDYLKQHNLFLANVNGQNELYCYPPQLRKLLQQNLAVECRSRYLQLHGRAARYFEANSQLHEALEHYQQAEKALAQFPPLPISQDSADIKIYALGNLRVERHGHPIEGATWSGKSKAGRQKVKTLLAYLVERGSHGATKDELIEALWGAKAWGRDEARLEGSLARTLSSLRHVLEPELMPPTTSSFILNEEGRYYLNTTKCWLDVDIFQNLIKEARNAKLLGESETAQTAYQKASALYRAEYLRDIPGAEEWAGIQRYVLGQQLGVAYMSMGDYYLERKETKEALACYQKAIKQEPTNHTAHYMLIDVLKRVDRFEDAILAYHRCRKIFNQEIDENPPKAIIELYESIRIQPAYNHKPSKHRVRLPALQ